MLCLFLMSQLAEAKPWFAARKTDKNGWVILVLSKIFQPLKWYILMIITNTLYIAYSFMCKLWGHLDHDELRCRCIKLWTIFWSPWRLNIQAIFVCVNKGFCLLASFGQRPKGKHWRAYTWRVLWSHSCSAYVLVGAPISACGLPRTLVGISMFSFLSFSRWVLFWTKTLCFPH